MRIIRGKAVSAEPSLLWITAQEKSLLLLDYGSARQSQHAPFFHLVQVYGKLNGIFSHCGWNLWALIWVTLDRDRPFLWHLQLLIGWVIENRSNRKKGPSPKKSLTSPNIPPNIPKYTPIRLAPKGRGASRGSCLCFLYALVISPCINWVHFHVGREGREGDYGTCRRGLRAG